MRCTGFARLSLARGSAANWNFKDRKGILAPLYPSSGGGRGFLIFQSQPEIGMLESTAGLSFTEMFERTHTYVFPSFCFQITWWHSLGGILKYLEFRVYFYKFSLQIQNNHIIFGILNYSTRFCEVWIGILCKCLSCARDTFVSFMFNIVDPTSNVLICTKVTNLLLILFAW